LNIPIMAEEIMLKKLATASLVSVVLIAGAVSPVQAATVKQGTACTKSGAKATSGKNSYVCQKNPATASAKLVWVTTDCITAAKTYQNTKKESDSFVAQQTTALTKIQASIASWKNVVVLLDQKKAALETNLYTVDTDNATKQPVKVTGLTAAIAATTAKIADLTTKRDNALAKSTAASTSATDKANWTKAVNSYNMAIKTKQRDLDNFNKVVPKIDSDRARAVAQIASMQTQLDASTTSQTQLTTQVTDGAKQALSFQTIACKAGL
jgi:chromosome segregation ATPase